MVSWESLLYSGMSDTGYFHFAMRLLLFCILNPFIILARRLISWALGTDLRLSDWLLHGHKRFLCTNPKDLLRSSELQMGERKISIPFVHNQRCFSFIVDGVVFRVCIAGVHFWVLAWFCFVFRVTEAVTSCSLRQKDTTYRTISFLSAQTVVGVLLGYGGVKIYGVVETNCSCH
jgi:hypothetical protein